MPITPQEVRAIREQLGFSQREFADRLGVALNTVSRWELGERTPNEAVARLIWMVAEHEGLGKPQTRKAAKKR